MDNIKEFLNTKQDLKYRDFIAKLIPKIDKSRIKGVRVPELRKYTKLMTNVEEYLNDLPHEYIEEYHIHMYLLDREKDIDILIGKIEKILPYIDNWATCDIGIPKLSKKYPQKIEEKIFKWLNSKHIYTVRFAIVILITNFIKENFKEKHLYILSKLQTDEYYINIAISWYFAECYKVHEEKVLKYIKENKILNSWVHNKTIQKIKESLKVEKSKKDFLNKLKRKY